MHFSDDVRPSILSVFPPVDWAEKVLCTFDWSVLRLKRTILLYQYKKYQNVIAYFYFFETQILIFWKSLKEKRYIYCTKEIDKEFCIEFCLKNRDESICFFLFFRFLYVEEARTSTRGTNGQNSWLKKTEKWKELEKIEEIEKIREKFIFREWNE